MTTSHKTCIPYFDLACIELGFFSFNQKKNLKNLSPEEARKMQRKYRKLWRKALKQRHKIHTYKSFCEHQNRYIKTNKQRVHCVESHVYKVGKKNIDKWVILQRYLLIRHSQFFQETKNKIYRRYKELLSNQCQTKPTPLTLKH